MFNKVGANELPGAGIAAKYWSPAGLMLETPPASQLDTYTREPSKATAADTRNRALAQFPMLETETCGNRIDFVTWFVSSSTTVTCAWKQGVCWQFAEVLSM